MLSWAQAKASVLTWFFFPLLSLKIQVDYLKVAVDVTNVDGYWTGGVYLGHLFTIDYEFDLGVQFTFSLFCRLNYKGFPFWDCEST